MEKLKALSSFLLKINVSLVVFLLYSVKLVYFGAKFEDSAVFLAVCAVYGYHSYLKSKKPEPVRLNNEVQTKLNELNKRINDAQMQSNLAKPKFKW